MTQTLTETLHYLISNIVTNPEDVKIDEAQGDNSQLVYTVHVHKDDMGLVIGKQGRIIRAIRDLIKLLAAKQSAYVDVVLAES